MVKVVAVRNPFDPVGSREFRDVASGRTVEEIVGLFYPDGFGYHDVAISIDGTRIPQEDARVIVPRDNSCVVFCAVPKGGDGKNPLAIVASLALLVAAPAIGAGIAGFFGAGSSFAVGIATAGVYTVGGLIISSVFPVRFPEATPTASLENSPTYGWQTAVNREMEGAAWPVLYGMHRVTPPLLSRHLTVDGDKQYMNLLFGVADHYCFIGATGAIGETKRSVWINDQPATEFKGVVCYRQLGHINQVALPAFKDTIEETLVGVELTDTSWHTRVTSGNAINEFRLMFVAPSGLWKLDKSTGNMMEHSVSVKVEFRHATDGVGYGSWIPMQYYNSVETTVSEGWTIGYWYEEGEGYPPDTLWYVYIDLEDDDPEAYVEGQRYYSDDWDAPVEWDTEGSITTRPPLEYHWTSQGVYYKKTEELIQAYKTFSGSSTNPIRRIATPPQSISEAGDQWEIRVALVDAPLEDASYGEKLIWDSIQEVTHDDFAYPGTALLSVTALANEQLSGAIPRVSVLANRPTVQVWTGAAYEAKAANNPAWACYDVLHKGRFIRTYPVGVDTQVEGIPAAKINYDAFESWADWCDSQGFSVNLYIDTTTSVRQALNMIGANGRGTVVQLGNMFTCIVDRPEETPVQRFAFGMGNIEKDSFAEEWLSQTDRANCVEVNFWDASDNYERRMVEVHAQDFDTTTREINKASVTLYGCTSRDLAIRYGKYLMNMQKYLTLTASWSADIDSIACVVGDVVQISHDVPQWGYSGRVVTGFPDSVILDREVTVGEGATYHIRVKHADDTFEEKVVTNGPGDHTQLSISGTWDLPPAQHDLYMFGEVDKTNKLFRVARIGRDQEQRRKIVALEYVAEVFDDSLEIPEPELISDLRYTRDLHVNEVYRGGTDTVASLTWGGVSMSWNVWYSIPRSGFTLARTIYVGKFYSPSAIISGLDYGVRYRVYVSHTDNMLDGEAEYITLVGALYPPDDVQNFRADVEGFSILFSWDAVKAFDLKGYEIRLSEYVPQVGIVPVFAHMGVIGWAVEGEEAQSPASAVWENSEFITFTQSTSFRWSVQGAGTYYVMIKAVDIFGNYSTNSADFEVEVGIPGPANVQAIFSGPNLVLTWTQVSSTGIYSIEQYQIAYGDVYESATVLTFTKATTYIIPVTWVGRRRFWVVGFTVPPPGEIVGLSSLPRSADANVVSPGAVVDLNANVIDNNVLLRWSVPLTGTLPIARYEVREGDTWAGYNSVVGNVSGTFSAIFEDSAGTYTYWVCAYDSAGNEGTPLPLSTTVSQPPDYESISDFNSTFGYPSDGLSYYDMIQERPGRLIGPFDLDQTIEEWIANGYSTMQDEIDAGYTHWPEPSPTYCAYQEIFDCEDTLTGLTKISMSIPTVDAIHGTMTVTPTISVSNNGVDWTPHAGVWQVQESDFRYVLATLDISGSGGNDTIGINGLNVHLDRKGITDNGSVEVTSNGIQVDFNRTFADIQSITLTPGGTSALIAVYDFVDIVNPTHFHVYVFDKDGADASGAGVYVSWLARGT